MAKGKGQLRFDDPRLKGAHSYGGSLRKDKKQRGARPLATKDPIHLVLRSMRAKGPLSFLRKANSTVVNGTLRRLARIYGIKVFEMANAGNHIHLLIKLGNRFTYDPFIRRLTGEIALAYRLKYQEEWPAGTAFWDFRPFTRIVQGWKGYLICRDYVWLNHLEAIGILPYSSERLKWSKSGQDPGWLRRVAA